MSDHSDVTLAVTLAPPPLLATETEDPLQQVASASQKVSCLTPYTHLSHRVRQVSLTLSPRFPGAESQKSGPFKAFIRGAAATQQLKLMALGRDPKQRDLWAFVSLCTCSSHTLHAPYMCLLAIIIDLEFPFCLFGFYRVP